MTKTQIRQSLARGYTHPKNATKELDSDLINAMAQEVWRTLQEVTDTPEQPESGCRCDGETVCRFCDKLDTPEQQKYEERRKLYQENGKKIIEIAHRYGIHELDLLKAMDEVKSLPIQEQPTQEIEPPFNVCGVIGNAGTQPVTTSGEMNRWMEQITAAVNRLQKGEK